MFEWAIFGGSILGLANLSEFDISNDIVQRDRMYYCLMTTTWRQLRGCMLEFLTGLPTPALLVAWLSTLVFRGEQDATTRFMKLRVQSVP